MRWPDLMKKKPTYLPTYLPIYLPTHLPTNLREHHQGAILDTCDIWDIWSAVMIWRYLTKKNKDKDKYKSTRPTRLSSPGWAPSAHPHPLINLWDLANYASGTHLPNTDFDLICRTLDHDRKTKAWASIPPLPSFLRDGFSGNSWQMYSKNLQHNILDRKGPPPPFGSSSNRPFLNNANDRNCSLQFHFWNENAWPDLVMTKVITCWLCQDSHQAAPPPASSVGVAVLLLLSLLVILGHVQQVNVSTNQPETGMTLLM